MLLKVADAANSLVFTDVVDIDMCCAYKCVPCEEYDPPPPLPSKKKDHVSYLLVDKKQSE